MALLFTLNKHHSSFLVSLLSLEMISPNGRVKFFLSFVNHNLRHTLTTNYLDLRKGYLRYKTITPQSVLSEALDKNFFYVLFSRYSSFCGFSHPAI